MRYFSWVGVFSTKLNKYFEMGYILQYFNDQNNQQLIKFAQKT